MVLKVETWKGKRYFVVREQGRLITWKKYAGSKTTKSQAIDIYNKNKTLSRSIKKDIARLTNFREVTQTTKSSYNKISKQKPLFSRPSAEVVQYVITGRYKGESLICRSPKIIKGQKTKDIREQTRVKFLKLLANRNSLDYEEDEGLKFIDKVRDLREGWVSYERIKGSKAKAI